MGSFGRLSSSIGLNLKQAIRTLRGLRWFAGQRRQFFQMQRESGAWDLFPPGAIYPVIGENSEAAGTASGHYFHQDLYVAQKVFSANPETHIDVGSRIDGLVAHIASFRKIIVMDIRPLVSDSLNIEFMQADLMNTAEMPCGVTQSLSCLHALEHLGLGRYGDSLDPWGWKKGLSSLHRLLVPGGTLYLSVPTSYQQRVEFNAHRVFSIPFLLDNFSGLFEVDELAFVHDSGNLTTGLRPTDPGVDESFGATYGCSIWTLTKT